MAVFPRTWAEVDLGALRHNLVQIKAALGRTKLCLVSKADAYGHGLVPASRVAAQIADFIGVATVPEGISLREAEIDIPILVLAPTLPMEAKHAVFYGLRLSVESIEAAAAISAAAVELGTTARVHLKVDTGMSRFGAQVDEAVDIACAIRAMPNLELEGCATHFANSGKEPEYTRWQYERFEHLLKELEKAGISIPIRHCANSGALARFPTSLLDMARIGILAYGISHIGEVDFELRPVLTWKARIMATRWLQPGTSVSYNLTYKTERRTRLATLGVGYGDGYHRFLGNKGWALVHGKRAPVRGVICMDQMMIDITDIPEAKLGDEAILVGEGVKAEELSEIVGTTPHEITTRIMSRVPRVYLGG